MVVQGKPSQSFRRMIKTDSVRNIVPFIITNITKKKA